MSSIHYSNWRVLTDVNTEKYCGLFLVRPPSKGGAVANGPQFKRVEKLNPADEPPEERCFFCFDVVVTLMLKLWSQLLSNRENISKIKHSSLLANFGVTFKKPNQREAQRRHAELTPEQLACSQASLRLLSRSVALQDQVKLMPRAPRRRLLPATMTCQLVGQQTR